MVAGDRESSSGFGRALPQSGFKALQPGRSNNANKEMYKDAREPFVRFMFLP
jgi:hypothetical protein